MKHLKLTTALLAVALVAAPSFVQAKPMAKSGDSMFVTKASAGGMFEVKSSEVALQKSSDASVKEFAQKMVDDHTKAGEKLKMTATDEKLQGALSKKLDSKHQAIVDKLKATPAAGFDAAYIKAQKDAHMETIALFEQESSVGKNAALKTFADDTLPTLKEHKEHVMGLKADKMDKAGEDKGMKPE